MGGVTLLLTIILVLCMVILCMRRSRKGSLTLNDKVLYTTRLNTDVTLQDNPSYDVNKANTIVNDKTGLNIPLTPNPSYWICTKACTEINEDGYAQANELIQHLGSNDNIKMEINPSYGVSTREDSVATFNANGATSDPNDYDYVNDDPFHNTT